MKEYIKVDKNGRAIFKDIELPFNQRFFEKIYLNEDEDAPNGYVLAYEQGGFWHPRWTGTQWIEDMTQEEIDELNNQPQEQSKAELLEQRINELELYILMQEGLI